MCENSSDVAQFTSKSSPLAPIAFSSYVLGLKESSPAFRNINTEQFIGRNDRNREVLHSFLSSVSESSVNREKLAKECSSESDIKNQSLRFISLSTPARKCNDYGLAARDLRHRKEDPASLLVSTSLQAQTFPGA